MRNLKTLGLAFMAVLALSAVVASAASAQTNGKLTSDGPVTLDATELAGKTNALTAFGNITECEGSILTGHSTSGGFLSSGAETVTLTPDYNQTKCHVLEGATTRKATVTMNGCDFVVHMGATVNNEANRYEVTADVECPDGKVIELDVYFASGNENIKVCSVTVGSQTGLKGAAGSPVVLTTDTVNDDLRVEGEFVGILVTRHGLCGAQEDKNGKFDINVTVTGTNAGGGSTGVTVTH